MNLCSLKCAELEQERWSYVITENPVLRVDSYITYKPVRQHLVWHFVILRFAHDIVDARFKLIGTAEGLFQLKKIT